MDVIAMTGIACGVIFLLKPKHELGHIAIGPTLKDRPYGWSRFINLFGHPRLKPPYKRAQPCTSLGILHQPGSDRVKPWRIHGFGLCQLYSSPRRTVNILRTTVRIIVVFLRHS